MPSTQHFSLKTTPGERLEFIISISKKISKKAVVRNTIRRRTRAVLAPLKSGLKPARYLFIVKPGAEEIRGEVLKLEIKKLMGL